MLLALPFLLAALAVLLVAVQILLVVKVADLFEGKTETRDRFPRYPAAPAGRYAEIA